MRSVTICPGVKELILGYQGENLAQQIAFDVNGWGSLYGSGVYELTVQPPNGGTPYPVTVTVSGNQVLWAVTDADTATAGTGKAQLSYYVGEKLAKSQVWPTKILKSVGATGDAPDAYETWLSTLQALAAETQQNAEDAEDSAEAAAASATEAAGYASTAANQAAAAAARASEAGISASAAAQSATAAAGSASAAATSEGNARIYELAAQSASNVAEMARDAAVIAQGKAEDAQDAAEDAQTAAEAAQAAIENMTVSSTTLSPGSAASVTKTESGGVVNLAFGLPQGVKGDTGATGPQGPAGVGVPTGGTTGQVLKKASGTDYDTVWANESGGGGSEKGIYYGFCSTAGGTQTKAVTIAGITELAEGLSIRVRFDAGQTYNGIPHLNLNGLGAAPICRGSGTRFAERYEWRNGEVVDFVYDGTYWVIANGEMATTTYYGMTKLSSSTSSTSATEAATPAAVKLAYDLAAAAIPAPSSPATGAYLVWNGTAWVAQTLPVYNGGVS